MDRLSAPGGGDSYAMPSVEYKYKSSRGNTEDGTAVTEHWSAGNGLWLHQAVRGCLSRGEQADSHSFDLLLVLDMGRLCLKM